MLICAFAIVGSSLAELKLFGPDHTKVSPPVPVAFKVIVSPLQYAPVLDAEIIGFGLTVTVVVSTVSQPVVVLVRLTV